MKDIDLLFAEFENRMAMVLYQLKQTLKDVREIRDAMTT